MTGLEFVWYAIPGIDLLLDITLVFHTVWSLDSDNSNVKYKNVRGKVAFDEFITTAEKVVFGEFWGLYIYIYVCVRVRVRARVCVCLSHRCGVLAALFG